MALVKYGPAFVANAAANIYTPPASPILTVIRQIHLSNVDTVARAVTLYIGATGGSAAATTVLPTVSIPANSTLVLNPIWPLKSTDFLSGVAATASTITIVVSTDQSVIP